MSVELILRKDLLAGEGIFLESIDYDTMSPEYIDIYEYPHGPEELMINVHRDTGEVLLIVLELFTDTIREAVKALRDYPLPWTFTVSSMDITEKPLEEVLLAIYKKNKKA